MATLIRFMVGLLSIGIVVALAMWALASFVEPRQQEIVIEIPEDRLGL